MSKWQQLSGLERFVARQIEAAVLVAAIWLATPGMGLLRRIGVGLLIVFFQALAEVRSEWMNTEAK